MVRCTLNVDQHRVSQVGFHAEVAQQFLYWHVYHSEVPHRHRQLTIVDSVEEVIGVVGISCDVEGHLLAAKDQGHLVPSGDAEMPEHVPVDRHLPRTISHLARILVEPRNADLSTGNESMGDERDDLAFGGDEFLAMGVVGVTPVDREISARIFQSHFVACCHHVGLVVSKSRERGHHHISEVRLAVEVIVDQLGIAGMLPHHHTE